MSHPTLTLFWFRQDLRLSDNPGLWDAAQKGDVLPIYILDDQSAGEYKMGSASRWWLHTSLDTLNQSLDNKLNYYVGKAQDIFAHLLKNHSINAVHWNRCYEPWRIQNDHDIKTLLEANGVACETFNSSLLKEPWEVLKDDGEPYKVFTAFYKKAQYQSLALKPLLKKPKTLTLVQDHTNKNTLNDLDLLSHGLWESKIAPFWKIGELAAQKKCLKFIKTNLLGYQVNRDYPSKPATSRLSPHLHFGEISPYQVFYCAHSQSNPIANTADKTCFIKELAWREFSYYLLYHFPELPRQNFQSQFNDFPWEAHPHWLEAWQKGQTGYPIIDAGMRELWQTGYMHNRVRMIVGSFLIKNCLLHWHHGEAWFWDCLVDADLASNSASWQWVAGSGADAAPYFRIFNPVTQGEKFDTNGEYTRHFVPELKALPDRYLFKPWEAPVDVLKAAGVTLGVHYPKPIIDLKASREKAMEAYRIMKSL